MFYECSNSDHNTKKINSPFERDKIPEKWMRKNPENEESPLCKRCYHCRKCQSQYLKDLEKRRKENAKELNKKEGIKFGYCSSRYHSKKSKYSREKVPIEELRKVPNNYNSEIMDTCISCRIKKKQYSQNRRIKMKEEFENEGKIICLECTKEINHENKAYNLDGSVSKKCKRCKDRQLSYEIGRKKNRKEFVYEIIRNSQFSCCKCKFLFFMPDEGSIIVKQFPTYLKEGCDGRYFKIDNKEYSVQKDFDLFKNNLATSIIEFDHLTEEEQRERGLIKPEDEYIPKSAVISDLTSFSAKYLELLKCQHLCSRCHVEETIRRQNENLIGKNVLRNPTFLEKKTYVDNLKNAGCSCCGYVNNNLLRFFEFDHIDPSDKIMPVSQIVRKYNYNLEDLIEECNKCRILCRFCHTMRTIFQKNGIDYISDNEIDEKN